MLCYYCSYQQSSMVLFCTGMETCSPIVKTSSLCIMQMAGKVLVLLAEVVVAQIRTFLLKAKLFCSVLRQHFLREILATQKGLCVICISQTRI